MSEFEVCQLGAARLDATTRAPLTQAVKPTAVPENNEPFGELPTYSALGVTAVPAAASSAGACEGLVAQDAAGLPGVIVGMRDLRVAGIVAELAAGETCLHAVDPTFESRVFCKDKIVALIIGDDTTFILDKAANTATLAVGGSAFQVTADGITMSSPDGTGIEIKNGSIKILGTQVYLGNSETGLGYLPAGGVVTPGPSPPAAVSPSVGVFVSALPI